MSLFGLVQFAQDSIERKKTVEQIIHEAKCSFFKVDPRTIRQMVPFCVNISTGQWHGENMQCVPTPPSHVRTNQATVGIICR